MTKSSKLAETVIVVRQIPFSRQHIYICSCFYTECPRVQDETIWLANTSPLLWCSAVWLTVFSVVSTLPWVDLPSKTIYMVVVLYRHPKEKNKVKNHLKPIIRLTQNWHFEKKSVIYRALWPHVPLNARLWAWERGSFILLPCAVLDVAKAAHWACAVLWRERKSPVFHMQVSSPVKLLLLNSQKLLGF